MDRKSEKINSRFAEAVVKVGQGRGFIVWSREELPPFRGVSYSQDNRLVITAAHCLPWFPPCTGASHIHERTYRHLLGKLGARKADVWAQCLFVDPIADIAVLGSPDNQELHDESTAYDALTEKVPPIPVGDPPAEGRAWLLSLAGQWDSCAVKFNGNSICIEKTTKIEGGMSGSPILSENEKAIGIVCLGAETGTSDCARETEDSFNNPALANHLPALLWRSLSPGSEIR